MAISFKQFLDESINDKGILKAIFVVGIAGAGKSYTISKLKGPTSPRVVNTDRATEFLSQKYSIPANEKNWRSTFRDSSIRITSKTLFGYLNGMLPLFIDGTSNDVSNILARAGLLESLGYDVGMVFINTSLETAQDRANERAKQTNRFVNIDFIKRLYDRAEENKSYFKDKFPFFVEVNNDPGEFDDKAILATFRKVESFYDEPVLNPVGRRTIEKLENDKEKYLVPTILSEEELLKKVNGWYRSLSQDKT